MLCNVQVVVASFLTAAFLNFHNFHDKLSKTDKDLEPITPRTFWSSFDIYKINRQILFKKRNIHLY